MSGTILGAVIGFIIGWIVEWLMDLFYFRNKRICSDAEQQLRASVRQLEADNTRMSHAVTDLTADVESKDADMRRQEARFQAAQNDTSKQLEQGSAQLRERIGVLESELAVKNAEIDDYNNRTQTLDVSSLQRLQDENDGLKAKNAELRGSVHDKDAEIQRLSMQAAAKPAPAAPTPPPAAVAAAAPAAAVAATSGFSAATPATPSKPDDLKKLWGIGPALERILNRNGITTFTQLSQTSVERLDEILESAGTRFQLANQKTWPQQAGLAQRGAWDELERIQKSMSWD